MTPPLTPSPIPLASLAFRVRPAHFIDASAAYVQIDDLNVVI